MREVDCNAICAIVLATRNRASAATFMLLQAVELGDDVPGFLRRFGVVDQLEVFVVDDAFVGQPLES